MAQDQNMAVDTDKAETPENPAVAEKPAVGAVGDLRHLLAAVTGLETVKVTISERQYKATGKHGLFLGSANIKTTLKNATDLARNLEKTGNPAFQAVGMIATAVGGQMQTIWKAAYTANPTMIENPEQPKNTPKVKGTTMDLNIAARHDKAVNQ